MSQHLFIERGHISGPVDFTKSVFEFGDIKLRKNDVGLFEFSVVNTSAVPGWFKPTQGDYVTFEDTRWESRYASIKNGVLFSGFIATPPEYKHLGRKAGTSYWGFECRCASEDFLINSKRVPARIFVNKTRGYILRALLEEMFGDADVMPLDITNIHDGGTERIYATDPSKPWTLLASEFGEADGYVYFVSDRQVFYIPEMSSPFRLGNTTQTLTLDESDPRYVHDKVAIREVETTLVNDLTIIGEDEPDMVCLEQFVSDGYQPGHDLLHVPYGIESSTLIDDDFGSDIDSSMWEEVDVLANYIRPFEGSLNVIGGPGDDASPTGATVFLRARKGIELTGVIQTRDGEIAFVGTTGTGIIGGMYSDEVCSHDSLWAGWYIDQSASIRPMIDGYATYGSGVTIAAGCSYVLRRTITVNQFGGLPAPLVDHVTGQQYDTQPVQAKADILWEVEEINASDPDNIITTRIALGTTTLDCPPFVLYAAIVPYTCHLVMNNLSITRPSQFKVEKDMAPVLGEDNVWTLTKEGLRVGSAIDGGQCTVVADNGTASLKWYAVSRPAMALAGASQHATTIPPRGSVVSIRYYKNEAARARLKNYESIMAVKARFKDDGVRQLTMTKEEIRPAPRTSEECLFIARAVMADRMRTRYQGSYEFETKAEHETDLVNMPMPGDKIECTLDSPDGGLVESLDVTNVNVSVIGLETYLVRLEFGPVNRFDAARRELLRRRNSSLQALVVPDLEAFDAGELDANGYAQVPDPLPPQVALVGPDYITVTFGDGPGRQSGISGYEVRHIDGGWGRGGEIARMDEYTRGFNRFERDVTYFFRPYREEPDGSSTYAMRSAMVRHVFPMKNTVTLTGITGEWSSDGDVFKFYVPMPASVDWAMIRVRSGGDQIYYGDGVNHVEKMDHVVAFLSNGKIQLEIKDIDVTPSLNCQFLPVNVLGEDADNIYETNLTVTK